MCVHMSDIVSVCIEVCVCLGRPIVFLCPQASVVEAIRIMNELARASGSEQQKMITELSDQARDNPLLPDLLNIAKRAGVTGLEEGKKCVYMGK